MNLLLIVKIVIKLVTLIVSLVMESKRTVSIPHCYDLLEPLMVERVYSL